MVTVAGADSVTVKNGSTALTATTDYTFSNGTLTVKSSYLNEQAAGTATLTITDEDGETGTLTVTVTTLTVSPATATFDKAAAADLTFTVTNGTMTSLKNGTSAVNTDNYTISEGTLTIKQAYLAGLTNGDKTFKAVSAHEEAAFTVTVTGETPSAE